MPASEKPNPFGFGFSVSLPEKHYICEVNDKQHINMEHNILIPLLLTLGAGLATGIGSAIAFFARRTNKRLLSGLAEPVGALLAYLVLMPFMSPTLMGCILAGVAGIMVFISIDELLPAAREYGEAHISIYGVVAGMALMAVSLILLA